MLAGLSTVTYLPSLSHAPTKAGVAHHPKPSKHKFKTDIPHQNRRPHPKPPAVPPHDVVVASYVLREVEQSASRDAIIRSLWAHTSGVLVIVEPGTPVGFERVRHAREVLIKTAGDCFTPSSSSARASSSARSIRSRDRSLLTQPRLSHVEGQVVPLQAAAAATAKLDVGKSTRYA